MTLDQALREARVWWKDENLAERTMGNYERALRRLDRELGLLQPNVAGRLKRWRDGRQRQLRAAEISASHVSGDRSALISFYDALVARRIFSENPARSLTGVPQPPGRPRPIPVADQEKMLRLPDLSTFGGLRDRAVLECLRHGMRQGEVAGLRISGVTFDEREDSLFLEFRAKGKNRQKKVRDVPFEHGSAILVAWYILERFARRNWQRWLDQETGEPYQKHMAALQKLLYKMRARDDLVFVTDSGHRLYQVWVSRMFSQYRDTAGVDSRFTPHTFRHRFCTSLLENNVDLRISMRLTGHEDVRSIMRYTDVARAGAVVGVGAIGAAPGVPTGRNAK